MMNSVGRALNEVQHLEAADLKVLQNPDGQGLRPILPHIRSNIVDMSSQVNISMHLVVARYPAASGVVPNGHLRLKLL